MENLRKQISIKKIVLLSVLVALSVILSVFDKMISGYAFPFLPTAKIGLANIVIVVAVYRFKFKESLTMVILKSLLAGLMIGGAISFIISLFASLVSFFGMYFSFRLLKKIVSPISISVIGGFLHIAGQLFIVEAIYKIGSSILSYGAVLLFVSLVTSIIIGFIALKMLSFLDKVNYENS